MTKTLNRPAHPLPIRIMHWIAAPAVICMMLSGWAIYNASPSLPFTFPRWMTLGGWLAGGIAWHISVMWVLFIDGIAYLLYGFASGHFRRDLFPPSPRAVIDNMVAALTGRLGHSLGHYNAVQRLLYAGVIVLICFQVLTGFAIWKPVQLGWLTELLGGYPIARGIHLAAMIGIALFLVVHLTLVVIFPRTLVAMLSGTASEPEEPVP
ncbi:MAG TPA: cytochrome b/b6 domain-containing protein [Rhizomicrobium sp.]